MMQLQSKNWRDMGSEYEKSLEMMDEVFQRMQERMGKYARDYGTQSKVGKHLAGMWLHPKGITNLIKTITMYAHRHPPKFSHPLKPENSQNLPQKQCSPAPHPIIPEQLYPSNSFEKGPNSKPSIKLPYFNSPLFKKPLDFPKISPQPFVISVQPNSVSVQPQSGASNKNKHLCELFQPTSRPSLSLMEEENTEEKQLARGPYKRYTIEDKKRAVELMKNGENNIKEISRELGIPMRNLKRWEEMRLEARVEENKPIKCKHKRSNDYMEMFEKQVLQKLKREFHEGSNLTMYNIRMIAEEVNTSPNFNATLDWAIQFVSRYHLRKRYKMDDCLWV